MILQRPYKHSKELTTDWATIAEALEDEPDLFSEDDYKLLLTAARCARSRAEALESCAAALAKGFEKSRKRGDKTCQVY